MAFKITGFLTEQNDKKETIPVGEAVQEVKEPRKSVVQVRFPDRNMALSYYNDRFDLKQGDLVYVDGKLEGLLGLVTEVNYNFKIKVSEYQKIIAVVNTEVHGAFYMAGSHFEAFDPLVMPARQIATWFRAPSKEEDEFVTGNDDASFNLDDLSQLKISKTVAERGYDYFMENRVRYISIEEGKGFAIVEGEHSYAVEFEYNNGEIRSLICDCPCSGCCKHEFAAMLQLQETLDLIKQHYPQQYHQAGCFAAIHKGTLFRFAVANREQGMLTL